MTDTLELETMTDNVSLAVANLLPDSALQDDGGGPYISIGDPKGEENYFNASLPTLFRGADCKWNVWDSEHNVDEESDTLDAKSDPADVAQWITEQYEAWLKR